MNYARIIGTGSYLPEKHLSNIELESMVDTNHQWIVERTGIHARHISNDEETVSFMASRAALQALDMAGLKANDLDMIICASCTAEKIFPSAACLIQERLKISHTIPAFDIQAACSGFIYALSIAEQFIKNGTCKRCLVVGSEVMSKLVDWQDRATCVLFGDGAGAVVVQADDKPGILSTHLGAQGAYQELLYANNTQVSKAVSLEPLSPYLSMQGNQVFRHAVQILKQVALESLQQFQISANELDWLVPHQANIRIIQATAEKMQLPMSKVIITLDQQGNTSSASIPLALDSAIRQQKIKPGHTVLMEAFGGGFTWGTALMRY